MLSDHGRVFPVSVGRTSHRQQPFIEVFTDRLARLWPVVAFSALISFIVLGLNKETAVYEISMVFSTGIIADYGEYVWYIAPYF